MLYRWVSGKFCRDKKVEEFFVVGSTDLLSCSRSLRFREWRVGDNSTLGSPGMRRESNDCLFTDLVRVDPYRGPE